MSEPISSQEPNIWILQANPNVYKIEETLALKSQEIWNLRRNGKEVRKGDKILIWMCGDDAGIYSVGKVLTDPVLMEDTDENKPNWTDPKEGRKVFPRVLVSYEHKLLDWPLSRKILEFIPGLENLSIFQSAQGTVFRVKPKEWQIICNLLRLNGTVM